MEAKYQILQIANIFVDQFSTQLNWVKYIKGLFKHLMTLFWAIPDSPLWHSMMFSLTNLLPPPEKRDMMIEWKNYGYLGNSFERKHSN